MAKLVRDNIPEIIRKSGSKPNFFYFDKDNEQVRELLFNKLQEEVEEAVNAKDDFHLIEELADIYEVLLTICRHTGLSEDTFVDIANIKRHTNGSFKDLAILVGVVPPSEEGE